MNFGYVGRLAVYGGIFNNILVNIWILNYSKSGLNNGFGLVRRLAVVLGSFSVKIYQIGSFV